MKIQKQKPSGNKSVIKSFLWRNLAFLIIWSLLVLPVIVFAITAKKGSASVVNLPYGTSETISNKIFAKILFDVYKPKAATVKNCYKDVKKNDATAPAICALRKAKIFSLSAKNFSPNSKTSWDFAITSLCRAEKWPTGKTFLACSKYAKEQGFLISPPFPAKLKKQTKITYGELVSLLDAIKNVPANGTTSAIKNTPPENSSNQPANGDVKIPTKNQESLTFSPVQEGTIAANFFENIALLSPIKNTFFHNEVYFIEGEVVGKTTDEVLIFLCKKKYGCDNSVNFIGPTSGSHFKIPVSFNEMGNFQIGIIPGRSGESNIEDISVIPEPLLMPSGGSVANSLSVAYSEGKTTFQWNGEGTHTNLIVFQDNKRRDFIFMQGTTSFAPPSADLQGFKKGNAYWMVTQNGLSSPIKPISLTIQEMRKIETDKIKVTNLQEMFQSPGHLKFTGRALSTISKKTAITMPNGQVKTLSIAENDIPAQQNFQIETDFDSLGTYIFEVNSPDGNAVVNVPIYVGNSMPLLPDFFALHSDETLDTSPLTDLNQARQKMLQLINADRADYSLSKVVLADDLNAIAQSHSENMVKLNFFAHVDPSGNSPDMRRKKGGVTTPIRENLGKAANLESVEAGLMRSPVHREAILDPSMKRVGIGAAKDSEGYLLVTQNFAPNPIALSDLPSIENDLFEKANSKHISAGLPPLAHQTFLRDLASSWSSRMASEGFFGLTDSSGQQLLEVIREQGVKSAIGVNVVQVSAMSQLEEELLKGAAITDPTNVNIGIGLGINAIGEIFMTVIYTP